MIDIILAVDSSDGIGKNGILPWQCKAEMDIFTRKTIGAVLIMGSKTVKTLPQLKDREIYTVSRCCNTINENCLVFGTVEDAITHSTDKKTYIAGGAEIYKYAFEHLLESINAVHISVMKKSYNCDTFFKPDLTSFVITSHESHEEFDHYELRYVGKGKGEQQYLNVLRNVLTNGTWREGRNGKTISTFAEHLKFDLTAGFPLITTKKCFFRGIVEELLFFLRGDTDSKLLEEKNVNIWKQNTSRSFLDSNGKQGRREGVLGPMYGYMWRHFGAKYNELTAQPSENEKGIDQIDYVVNLIKTDPHSRRIILTSYNPEQVNEGVLYPCHSIIIQFYVDGDYLDMYSFGRSSDTFLGLPFNIASYALFMSIIAKISGKKPRYLNITLGDTHIYESHLDIVNTQVNRTPFEFPQLTIKDIKSITDLTYDDFTISNYKSHGALKAVMIA
jgi:dihydrofolate reductase/thymidylate synthase